MVMALSIFHQADTLTLVAGYENGLAIVAQLGSHGNWAIKYQAQCHSQPILSLDVSPHRDFFLTSSADAVIAKHPLPLSSPQSPSVSQDAQTTTEPTQNPTLPRGDAQKSLLSAALSKAAASPSADPQQHHPQATPALKTGQTTQTNQQQPLKTVNTRHAGQQSLRIRSDARIFATAGWDARVRVYSAKTLAEVAVLKWHAVGCYAAAFAVVDSPSPQEEEQQQGGERIEESGSQGAGVIDGGSKDVTVVPKLVEMSVREKRVQQARTAHWLAAGSKDGKVSLWDVF
jgi:WD40 repeat protein